MSSVPVSSLAASIIRSQRRGRLNQGSITQDSAKRLSKAQLGKRYLETPCKFCISLSKVLTKRIFIASPNLFMKSAFVSSIVEGSIGENSIAEVQPLNLFVQAVAVQSIVQELSQE